MVQQRFERKENIIGKGLTQMANLQGVKEEKIYFLEKGMDVPPN
jgi:hypothetical protein